MRENESSNRLQGRVIIDPESLIQAPVYRFKDIGSTNDEALRRAREEPDAVAWVRADRQTQGRGRQGRSWTSPVGNLYTSLILPGPAGAPLRPQIAHVAAVALVEALRAIVGVNLPIRVKWPNDVLISQAKVAGILVEATSGAHQRACYVVGWGVNCAHHPKQLAYETTDLTTAANRFIGPDAVFDALRPAMGDALAVWKAGDGFAAIRERWLARALPLGTILTARLSDRTVEGGFGGMDETGRLLLDTVAGRLTIQAADIHVGTLAAGRVG